MTPEMLHAAPDGTHKVHGTLYARKSKGRATFLIKNGRTPAGARTAVTCHLGKFPELSIAKAKQWQKEQEALFVEYLRNKKLGIKPARKTTLGDLITRYVEYCDTGSGNKSAWSPKTYRANYNRIKKYLHPHPLWNTQLAKMDRSQLRELYVAISIKANNQAYKIYHLINPALKKAVDLFDGLNVDSLIFREVPFVKAKAVKHTGLGFLDGGDAIRAMYQQIDLLPCFAASKLALKTIMLTAQRPGEVCQMRKSQYDGQTLINLRAHMKVKNRSWDVALPVTGELKAVLDLAMQLDPHSPFLFPSFSGQKRARGHVSETSVQQLCNKASGGACVPHGFRTSLTSYAKLIKKVPVNAVDWVLDHVASDMTNQSYVNHAEGDPLAIAILLDYQRSFTE